MAAVTQGGGGNTRGGRQTGGVGVNVLLDTHVLLEPMRQRLPKGRRRARLDSDVQAVLASGLTVRAYDTTAALWHGEQLDISPPSPQRRAWCW